MVGRVPSQSYPGWDIRIGYLRDLVDRGQSIEAAPLTELLVFYTLLHLYNYSAAGSALSWTFCDTVWKNLSIEEFSRRCSGFPVCQMMEGAALVDNRSGVTFDAELCIPVGRPEGSHKRNLDGGVHAGIAPTRGRLARPRWRHGRPTDPAGRGWSGGAISEAGSVQRKQGILRCQDTGHEGSRGAADFGGNRRHFARDTGSPWRQHWGPVGCQTAHRPSQHLR